MSSWPAITAGNRFACCRGKRSCGGTHVLLATPICIAAATAVFSTPGSTTSALKRKLNGYQRRIWRTSAITSSRGRRSIWSIAAVQRRRMWDPSSTRFSRRSRSDGNPTASVVESHPTEPSRERALSKPSRDREGAVCDEVDRVRQRWRAQGTAPGASGIVGWCARLGFGTGRRGRPRALLAGVSSRV